jgi:hypothetical protein
MVAETSVMCLKNAMVSFPTVVFCMYVLELKSCAIK